MMPMRLMMAASAVGGDVSGIIQSIQQVEITVAASATTGTTTINAVDLDNTFFSYNWRTTSNTIDDPDHIELGIDLVNSTTIRATRNTGQSNVCVASVTIIEFIDGVIESNQSGTVDFTTSLPDRTTATDTLGTAVVLARSFVIWNGQTSPETSSNDFGTTSCSVSLSGTTTVEGQRGKSASAASVYYTVIQLASEYVESIQQVEIELTGSALTDTAPISSVDLDNTIQIFGGTGGIPFVNGNVIWGLIGQSQLTDVDEVTAWRGVIDAASNECRVATTVLEFKSGVLNSVQRGRTAVSNSDTTTVQSISTVDVDKSVAHYLGNIAADINSSPEPSEDFFRLTLASSTAINLVRAVGNADYTRTMSWEVWEFA